MILSFSPILFAKLMFCCLLIVGSWVIRNKVGEVIPKYVSYITAVTYISGWTLFAMSLGDDIPKQFQIYSAITLIIASVIYLGTVDHSNISYFFMFTLCLGWFGLVNGINGSKSRPTISMSVLGACLILIGILVVMPKQREDVNVDGVGAYMIGIGWVLVALSSSLEVN